MKKILFIIIALAFAFCSVSCTKEPEEIELTRDNAKEYLSATISFGNVEFISNPSAIYGGKYYLTCTATISIKPRGDYIFKKASVACSLSKGGKWKVIKKADGITATDFLYKWSDSIEIDKEGYAETTVLIFLYSDDNTAHPYQDEWECTVNSATGTVIEK